MPRACCNAAFASRPADAVPLSQGAAQRSAANHVGSDVEQQFAPIGVARKVRVGPRYYARRLGQHRRSSASKPAAALETAGVEAEVLDLRSLSPWDERAVIASAEKTARLLVVHEDNPPAASGPKSSPPSPRKPACRSPCGASRGPTRYVPCNFANQIEVLPSLQRVLTAAAELLNLDLPGARRRSAEAGVAYDRSDRQRPRGRNGDRRRVAASKPGDAIAAGQPWRSLEATKSVFELTSPVAGMVEAVVAARRRNRGRRHPLVMLRLEDAANRARGRVTQEQPGTPVSRAARAGEPSCDCRAASDIAATFDVGICDVGGRQRQPAGIATTNCCRPTRGMTADDIVRRTGIERRRWAGPATKTP